jgi:serine phosphatase RsbU (regulator of sigma subunit)
LQSLESIAYPLGVRERVKVKVSKVALEPGDTLFFFTDGIVEAVPDGSDEVFGFERLEKVLQALSGEPPSVVLQAVRTAVEGYVGVAPRHDDQTLLALSLPLG